MVIWYPSQVWVIREENFQAQHLPILLEMDVILSKISKYFLGDLDPNANEVNFHPKLTELVKLTQGSPGRRSTMVRAGPSGSDILRSGKP